MEFVVAWFFTIVVMNEEIKDQQMDIDYLTEQVINQDLEIGELSETLDQHNSAIIKTATAHSSFYAAQQLENTGLQDDLEMLESRIEVLEMPQQ